MVFYCGTMSIIELLPILLLASILPLPYRCERASWCSSSPLAAAFLPIPLALHRRHSHFKSLLSTPFDLDLYDPTDDDDDGNVNNPFAPPPPPSSSSAAATSLAAPSGTRLVLGINKYSHDASICAADASTGEVLFATSKERLTRRKHDGGNAAILVETCLDALQLSVDDVDRIVLNNHHHRILPTVESSVDKMEWEEGLRINGGSEAGYCDEENLLSTVPDKVELSHHYAHAYSAAAQCPFDCGLVVVMDGMGETYRTMRRAMLDGDPTYVSDLGLCNRYGATIVPSDLDERASSKSVYDWREAESAYLFEKGSSSSSSSSCGGIFIKPIFKRFVEERTPPTLYNHGFESMDSIGALYSRASSHIFGDWNACGKVMGLAPWMGHVWDVKREEDGKDPGGAKDGVSATPMENAIMWGRLYEDGEGGFGIDRNAMMGMPHVARNDPDLFDEEGHMVRRGRYDFDDNDWTPDLMVADDEEAKEVGTDGEGEGEGEGSLTSPPEERRRVPTRVALDAISLSSRVQHDLEAVAVDFVRHFKDETGATNLCLAGGVALNSVLNGRLQRELGFDSVFVPSCPGDDGIAVGCCAYGLFGNTACIEDDEAEKDSNSVAVEQGGGKSGTPLPKLWMKPLTPFLGPLPTDLDMNDALKRAAPWLDVEMVPDDQQRLEAMAKEIESGGVVAWYHGRSELGPRALGHRSILADPRKKGLVRFINEYVKKRESFRPFAPSVLTEKAREWFDLGNDGAASMNNVSPYMSLTAQVKKAKRDLIPAVTHVDGSSRLQTVTSESEPLYHQLISEFYKITGVPMVLNTSFNTLRGEPIVESPSDAIRSFLCSMGSIEMLVMEKYVIKRKQANIRALLGEVQTDKTITKPSYPKRAGPVKYETSFVVGYGDDETQPMTRVQMQDRPMHNDDDDGWFELLDDLEGEILAVCDGRVGVNEIVSHYTYDSADTEDEKPTKFNQVLFENIVRRLIRLYEYTLISW